MLPLARVRSLLFGDALVSLPFAVYGGAAVPGRRGARRRCTARRANSPATSASSTSNCATAASTEPEWPRQDLYVTFRKTLLPEVEANLLAIPRKQRAMVRKGIERGLVGEIDERVDRFFELYADNQHRHGTPPFSRRYFEALRSTFGKDCEVLTVLDTAGAAGVVGAVLLLPRRGAAVLRRRRTSGRARWPPTTSSTGT